MTMRFTDLLLIFFLTSLDSVIAADTSEQPSSELPAWSFAIIGVVVGLLVLLLCYYIIRRRSPSKRTVNNIDHLEKHDNMDSSVAMEDTISRRNTQVYKPTMIEQDKIALPLPPPSNSLFSDKMELNSDDAMQLFERYMQTEKQSKGGLSTIDLDMPQQLVNTVQQKMGTIKCNLRQSLRRQKSKARATPGDAAPLHHMFDSPTRQSIDTPQKSLSELDRYTPTSSSGTPSTMNTAPMSEQKNLPLLDQGSTPTSAKSPLLASSSSLSSSSDSFMSSAALTKTPSPSPAPPIPILTEDTTEASAIHAARHVIRSASRKSKTRSTVIGDDTLLKMFNRADKMPSPDLDDPRSDNSAFTAPTTGFTTISGRSTKPGSSTRYLTNDILVRRASTLGRSHQAVQRKSPPPPPPQLDRLFDTSKHSDTILPANEKIEVTQVFDQAERQGTKATIGLHKDDILAEGIDSTSNSRKSSASVATMVRISQQHSQTWSGRPPSKRASIPLSPPDDTLEQQQQQQRVLATMSPISEKSGENSPGAFYTIRSAKQKRNAMPSWYQSDDKTPAEIERDHYLKTLYGNSPGSS